MSPTSKQRELVSVSQTREVEMRKPDRCLLAGIAKEPNYVGYFNERKTSGKSTDQGVVMTSNGPYFKTYGLRVDPWATIRLSHGGKIS